MKKLIVSLGMLALSIPAMAQYDKSSFLTQENILSSAIDHKSLSEQNNALTQLITIMQKMITINNAPARASQVAIEKQVLQYVQTVPRNKIVADKTTLMNNLNKFAATY